MWLADACSNGQLVPWCSLKTFHHPQSATLSFHPVAMRLITSCSFIRPLWLADVALRFYAVDQLSIELVTYL